MKSFAVDCAPTRHEGLVFVFVHRAYPIYTKKSDKKYSVNKIVCGFSFTIKKKGQCHTKTMPIESVEQRVSIYKEIKHPQRT